MPVQNPVTEQEPEP